MSLWKKLTGKSWKNVTKGLDKVGTAAAVGAATYYGGPQVAAGLISGAGQIYSTNKSIQASQEEIARQNAYNSPASQMQRLQEAGLNPLLVYSSGNVVGNQSGVASSDYSGYGRGVNDALSTYMAIDNHDMEMQMKAENLLNQQINNKYLEINNALQVMKTATEDKILQADLLTKQYQNNILGRDWDLIKDKPNLSSKSSWFAKFLGNILNDYGSGGFPEPYPGYDKSKKWI